MIKEYNFLTEKVEEIEKKATKIYDKQITKNKVLKYHCDYRKLEKAFEEYKEKQGWLKKHLKEYGIDAFCNESEKISLGANNNEHYRNRWSRIYWK